MFSVSGAVVGCLIGRSLARLRRPTALMMVARAGISLLLATVLFALLTSTAYWCLSIGRLPSPPNPAAQIVMAPVVWLFGLFRSGFVLPLWILSVINHFVFFEVMDRYGMARARMR
jgi:hypothetical protein